MGKSDLLKDSMKSGLDGLLSSTKKSPQKKETTSVKTEKEPAVHCNFVIYNPQIQISAESETKRSIFREKDKTKRSKKESAQHSKSRNKSFVMTSVSAL